MPAAHQRDPRPEVWRGRRVLVTGADGFIGSHLCEHLVREGAVVRALVCYNSWNQVGWLADTAPAVRDAVEVFGGDIRDEGRVAQAVADREVVFHLASLVGVPYSYQAPRAYLDTNVIGTLHVLEACRRSPRLSRLVQVSTSEVYGTARTVPIGEDHPLCARSPYAATKIAADQLAGSFHRSFGLPLVIARPFNTYGPRQTARAVIPTIAAQLLSGCRELHLGALAPTRDFVFVTDTAAALVALAGCAAAEGQVVHVGTGEEWSIERTARLLMEVCGREVPVVQDRERLRPPRSEVDRLVADAARLRDLTGWRPAVPFRDGLARTAEWIGRNLDRFAPGGYQL